MTKKKAEPVLTEEEEQKLLNQLFAEHADGLFTKVFAMLGKDNPDRVEAHISGAMAAVVRQHIEHTRAPGQVVTHRDVTVTLTPLLFGSAEAVLKSLKGLDNPH